MTSKFIYPTISLATEDDTLAVAHAFGRALQQSKHLVVVHLNGVLGAGKTTFCRGVLQAFGHFGAVKSPTYTLVEPYEFDARTVYHFDLYRLGEPEELDYMGIRDYYDQDGICLIEWPEKGAGFLPEPDLIVNLTPVVASRSLTLEAISSSGYDLLSSLELIKNENRIVN